MNNIKTYEDFILEVEKKGLNSVLKTFIDDYEQSQIYLNARTAQAYFDGENTAILNRRSKITNIAGQSFTLDLNKAKIPTNFFKLLVIQQSSTLLNFGLQTKTTGLKDRLGEDFDTTMSEGGENALIHGRTYFFWDYNHIVNFPIYTKGGGSFALRSQKTGQMMAFIRYWQVDINKPIYFEFYELDGQTEFVIIDDMAHETRAKRPYRVKVRPMFNEETADNYNTLPIVELKANSYGSSELTVGLKALIDQYDIIFSDFSDVMERIKGLLWVFNNFNGTAEDVVEIKKEIEALGIVAAKDDSTTATPHTIDIPFLAVQYALGTLKKAIYAVFMGYNTEEITGGSLTNVAIEAMLENLNSKVGRWERQQVVRTCMQIIQFVGVRTSDIKFRYDVLMNNKENDETVLNAFNVGVLDIETTLSKLSFIQPDELADVLQRVLLAQTGVPDENIINKDDNI